MGPRTIVVCHNTSRYLWMHYEHLLRALGETYERVVCITPRDGSESEFESAGLIYQPIEIHQHGMNPFQEVRFIYDLYRQYQKYAPDVVLNFSIKPCLYGALAGRMAGVKKIGCMVTGLGYVFLTPSLMAKMIRKAMIFGYPKLLSQKDTFFFQNPDDADLFAKDGISRSCRSVVLPGTGIDIRHFCASAPTPDKGKVRFLCIARLLKDKGIFEYYQAAKAIKQRYPDSSFGLLGPLDNNPSAIPESEVRIWHEEGVVEYLGETKDVRPYLLNADVFVLPSYREGLPRAGLEAMAMSRAVIASDAPGCRELVEVNKNGFLVPPKSSEHLVQAMEALIIDPEKCHQFGVASRGRCESVFDVNKVTNTILGQLLS